MQLFCPPRPLPSSAAALYPLPSTLYPLPSTLYPLPSTLYPLPSTLYRLPSTLYPLPSTLYPLPSPVPVFESLPRCCTTLCRFGKRRLVKCTGSYAVLVPRTSIFVLIVRVKVQALRNIHAPKTTLEKFDLVQRVPSHHYNRCLKLFNGPLPTRRFEPTTLSGKTKSAPCLKTHIHVLGHDVRLQACLKAWNAFLCVPRYSRIQGNLRSFPGEPKQRLPFPADPPFPRSYTPMELHVSPCACSLDVSSRCLSPTQARRTTVAIIAVHAISLAAFGFFSWGESYYHSIHFPAIFVAVAFLSFLCSAA